MGIAGRLAKFFLHSQLTPLIALVAMLLGLFAVLVTPREEETSPCPSTSRSTRGCTALVHL